MEERQKEKGERKRNLVYEKMGDRKNLVMPSAGNTKGGSITVPLNSCLTGLESAV
jgi:hypothetical protein